jgi:hypothetical protein
LCGIRSDQYQALAGVALLELQYLSNGVLGMRQATEAPDTLGRVSDNAA